MVADKTEQIGIRVTSEMKEQWARAADADGRTLTSLIVKAMTQWLRAQAPKRRKGR